MCLCCLLHSRGSGPVSSPLPQPLRRKVQEPQLRCCCPGLYFPYAVGFASFGSPYPGPVARLLPRPLRRKVQLLIRDVLDPGSTGPSQLIGPRPAACALDLSLLLSRPPTSNPRGHHVLGEYRLTRLSRVCATVFNDTLILASFNLCFVLRVVLYF